MVINGKGMSALAFIYISQRKEGKVMGIGSKLATLLEKNNTNPNELAKQVGVSAQTIYSIIKRDSKKADIEVLLKIADILGVTVEYFVEDSHPFVTDTNSGISSFDLLFLEKYHSLDPHGKDMVDTVLGKEVKRMEDLEKEPTANITPMRVISYYQRMASAGNGEYLFDDIPTDLIEVENTPLSRKADFVLGINGHSMEPTYYDGDKVLVRKTSDVPVGKIGVFTKNGECYIKELGKDRLISHNKDKKLYPDILPDGKPIDTIGEVLGKV